MSLPTPTEIVACARERSDAKADTAKVVLRLSVSDAIALSELLIYAQASALSGFNPSLRQTGTRASEALIATLEAGGYVANAKLFTNGMAAARGKAPA